MRQVLNTYYKSINIIAVISAKNAKKKAIE